jgi:cysteine desulfurase
LRKVYLDHAATTPINQDVLSYMCSIAGTCFGNPSSPHTFGRRARAELEQARESVQELIGANRSEEVVFTSGGTEADNFVLSGVISEAGAGAELATTITEHAAVYETALEMRKSGKPVHFIPLDSNGLVQPSVLDSFLNDHPAVKLVSIIWANNETGRINDIATLCAVCKEKNVLFHTDAVQAVGRLEVNVSQLGIDFLSASAHKFYGPMGIGILYVRRGSPIKPMIVGGDQQRGLRCGTENFIGSVGMGKAAEIVLKSRSADNQKLAELSNQLVDRLSAFDGVRFFTRGECLPGFVGVSFPGVNGESLLLSLDLDGIAVSSSSACHTGILKSSRVIESSGATKDETDSYIRIVLGRSTTCDDLDYTADCIGRHLDRLRG